jgi:hypothetical protein
LNLGKITLTHNSKLITQNCFSRKGIKLGPVYRYHPVRSQETKESFIKKDSPGNQDIFTLSAGSGTETYDIFPAEVYLKGFMRSYAQYLGLDADEIVRAYDRQHNQPVENVAKETATSSVTIPKINTRLVVWSITSFIAIILIFILILRPQ